MILAWLVPIPTTGAWVPTHTPSTPALNYRPRIFTLCFFIFRYKSILLLDMSLRDTLMKNK